MTTKELAKDLKEHIGCGVEVPLYDEELEVVVEALEKQIAKKPTVLINDKDVKVGCITFRKGVKTYKCTCGCWVTLSQDYCVECGQKLDWSE